MSSKNNSNNKQKRFDDHHMRNAINAATMSTAKILKVGVVITRDNRTIVNAWNGSITGSDNCCEEKFVTCSCGAIHIIPPDSYGGTNIYCDCGISTFANLKTIKTRTKRSVLHAEENAMLYAARTGIPLNDSTIYTTVAPCERCARMIIMCGINDVVYLEDFKNTLGLELLKKHNVEVTKLKLSVGD